MGESSRRQFLKSSLYMALSGWGTAFVSLGSGCKQSERPVEPSLVSGQKDESDPAAEPPNIDPDFTPGYVKLHRMGVLRARGEKLWQMMESCRLCPRCCGTNRLKGQEGFCHGSSQLEISAFHPHFGEEKPLVGSGGSGAIFLTNCGLRCVFCINWEVSHEGRGTGRSIENMASMMLHLQRAGCHNINVVTPTHYSPHIVLALDAAAKNGLRLPLVYNTCGWERLEILNLLDGIVDIYLPDFKYSSGGMAAKYSAAAHSYPEITKAALLLMHEQVGAAKPAADGLIYRGLMIRHLVMPNGVSGTGKVVEWIAANLPKETYVNIMSQYRPVYRAHEFPDIARRITREEFEKAVNRARSAGLSNLDLQRWPL